MAVLSESDPRLRVLASPRAVARPEFVLYWCQAFRRPTDNLALAYAIDQANARGLPCVVYEAIRPDYPFASDRFHTFVLEGARAMAAALAKRGLFYAFFLPKTPDEARGVVSELSRRAALVVSDDNPTFIDGHNRAAAKRMHAPFVVVDDNTPVPLALFPKQEFAARTIRPKVHKILAEYLKPFREPAPRVLAPPSLALPFDVVDFSKADVPALVAACAIDHAVPPVSEFPGGAPAAEKRLASFLKEKLRAYADDRNEPSRDATSHLSPYLHFGMISARRVALAAQAAAAESGARIPAASIDGFIEQLVVRRTLAFNFARSNPAHASYDALPDWAKKDLAAHEKDPRRTVSMEDLEAARSPDEVWNAAQLELRHRGIIHNYLRMLWGKLVLTWTRSPRDAHARIVHLNDKYALDGRDPDGYTNIGWCFGLHDRPWPEHAIFGKVRTMTSRSAQSKLDLDAYLRRAPTWRAALGI